MTFLGVGSSFWRLVFVFLLAAVHRGQCAYDAGFGSDSDLTTFVSRPDIKAPILDVKIYDEAAVEPGLFFIAPYAFISQQVHPKNYYQPCQTGPHIYDGRGELIWSGACSAGLPNQNACDFRVYQNGTEQYLSTIFYTYDTDLKGHGIMLDSSYNVVADVYTPVKIGPFNMHEFRVIDDGARVLYLVFRYQYVDVRAVVADGKEAGWVADMGFLEVDVATRDVLFEWWAIDHISLTESTANVSIPDGYPPESWNWLHLNSVTKNDDGDYMISARFTDAIYKISGKDGSILWRLGGTNSSFQMENFNFSRQHDAQWLSYNSEEEVISFLDNAADTTEYHTHDTSSAMIIRLDKIATPMTAHVVERYWRPDGELSHLRGNVQILPNTNAFIGWSEDAYITEHTSGKDQRVVMEAHFRSQRFVTYRAYKFNFTGTPSIPPDLKVIVNGDDPSTCIMALYVSWNGATEVASWKFYRTGDETNATELLGTKVRSGFETVFYHHGHEPKVHVSAVDAKGQILHTSHSYTVAPLPGWDIDILGAKANQQGTGGQAETTNEGDETTKDEL